jgi:hypothetical protein
VVAEHGVEQPAGASEAGEELLRSLLESHFVLTDRGGHVTRWSRPAESTFGLDADAAVGRPLAQLLGNGPLPGAGRVETTLSRRDGGRLPVELTLVPVRIGDSLEFNGLLELMASGRPADALRGELRAGYGHVLEWIDAVATGRATIADDEPTAGTIVVFHRREGAPAFDAAPPGEAAEPLPDSPASDELGRIHSQLAETRSLVEALREELREAREEAGAAAETRAAVEQLRGEVDAARRASTAWDPHRAAALARAVEDTATALDAIRDLADSARSQLDRATGTGGAALPPG